MAEVEKVQKPAGKVYEDVSHVGYAQAYNRLIQLRVAHPGVADHDLLMSELGRVFDTAYRAHITGDTRPASEIYESTSGMSSTAPAADRLLTKRSKKKSKL